MNPTLKRNLVLVLAVALLATLALPTIAERADDAKRKSKNGKTEGTIDGVGIVLEYGMPKVKERDLWGGLVPYGKVWRTGADEATTLTLDKAAVVGGKNVAAGTYSLFTIPAEGEWTIILNSRANQWGAYEYDKGQDVARFKATPAESDHVEEMKFVVDGDSIVFHWGTTMVPFTVAAN